MKTRAYISKFGDAKNELMPSKRLYIDANYSSRGHFKEAHPAFEELLDRQRMTSNQAEAARNHVGALDAVHGCGIPQGSPGQ